MSSSFSSSSRSALSAIRHAFAASASNLNSCFAAAGGVPSAKHLHLPLRRSMTSAAAATEAVGRHHQLVTVELISDTM